MSRSTDNTCPLFDEVRESEAPALRRSRGLSARTSKVAPDILPNPVPMNDQQTAEAKDGPLDQIVMRVWVFVKQPTAMIVVPH